MTESCHIGDHILDQTNVGRIGGGESAENTQALRSVVLGAVSLGEHLERRNVARVVGANSLTDCDHRIGDLERVVRLGEASAKDVGARVADQTFPRSGYSFLILALRYVVVAGLFIAELATRIPDGLGHLIGGVVELPRLRGGQHLALRHIARDDKTRIDLVSGRRTRDGALEILGRANQRRQCFGIAGSERFSRRIAGRLQAVIDVGLGDHDEIADIGLLLELVSDGLGSLHTEILVRALKRRDHNAVASFGTLRHQRGRSHRR